MNYLMFDIQMQFIEPPQAASKGSQNLLSNSTQMAENGRKLFGLTQRNAHQTEPLSQDNKPT